MGLGDRALAAALAAAMSTVERPRAPVVQAAPRAGDERDELCWRDFHRAYAGVVSRHAREVAAGARASSAARVAWPEEWIMPGCDSYTARLCRNLWAQVMLQSLMECAEDVARQSPKSAYRVPGWIGSSHMADVASLAGLDARAVGQTLARIFSERETALAFLKVVAPAKGPKP